MTSDPAPNDGAHPSPASTERPRRTGMKVAKWVALVILLVLVVGGIVLYMNLNRIVRSTVEKQSTNSLNVQTRLQSANVSLFGGEVSLNNFEVGSPQGFQSPQMMTLGGVDVGVKLSELRNDPLRVNEIMIKDPRLVIEMQGTKFNIRKFIESLPAGEEDPQPDDGSEPMKLIINDLRVQGASVVFRPDVAAVSSLPGIGQTLSGLKQEYVLNIPPLHMQNIGTGEGNQNGAAIKEVVTLLVTQLAAKAAESEELPPELRQVLSLNVGEITNMVKARLGEELNKQLDKIGEDLSKQLPGEAGEALEGILKDPSAATTNPAGAAQKAIGGLLKGRQERAPATQPR